MNSTSKTFRQLQNDVSCKNLKPPDIILLRTLIHSAQSFLESLWKTISLIILSRAKSSGRHAVEQHSICLLTWQINVSPLCLSDLAQEETPRLSHSLQLCIISPLPPNSLIIDRGGCLLVQHPCNHVIIRKVG